MTNSEIKSAIKAINEKFKDVQIEKFGYIKYKAEKTSDYNNWKGTQREFFIESYGKPHETEGGKKQQYLLKCYSDIKNIEELEIKMNELINPAK